jgi:threonyl-tRNA synthetase
MSGVLNGLFRLRKFTQDDAHVYCTEDQVKAQVKEMIGLTKRVYKVFNLKFDFELSTKPEKSMGKKEEWDKAELALQQALEEEKIPFEINAGDGAFYGPKIDVHVTDSIGRKWQCATIQVDFQMPQRFDLGYVEKDDKLHRPIMIHRTILGAVERFIGILIEHYAGKFPLWIAPVQSVIIPITDKHKKYAETLGKEFLENNIRNEVDKRQETVSYKIREAEKKKIPLILVVGDKEQKGKSVAVRQENGKVKTVKVKAFLKETTERINSRKK